jgi:hypothetical protein
VDRLDAMKVFVAALDGGSLAGAGRKLSRALAFWRSMSVPNSFTARRDRSGSARQGSNTPLLAGVCSPNSRRPRSWRPASAPLRVAR